MADGDATTRPAGPQTRRRGPGLEAAILAAAWMS